MSQDTHQTIKIEGAALQLPHVGFGQPVLLAHGIPGDVDTLEPVADCLGATVHAMTVSAS